MRDTEFSVKTAPSEIWSEYGDGQSYNSSIHLLDTVKKNEKFYIGEQWDGVNAPDLDKPVFNLLKRVVSFFISSIVSDDIAVQMTPMGGSDMGKAVTDMLSEQLAEVMELSGFKAKSRETVRNAAVDGSGCLHFYFEPGDEEAADKAGGDAAGTLPQGTPGVIEAEILDNTNVFFGNPQRGDVQKQPYIIVAFRKLVSEVKLTARENGQPADGIAPDSDENGINTDQEKNKVTVLRKYWKQRGAVWFTEVTEGAVVRKPKECGYHRYPLAWLPWEKVKNQYQGQAAITGLLPNQIFVNKLFAMGMQHVKMMAFPKVVYDAAKIPGGWSNTVGAAIPVQGDPNTAVASNFKAADMSNQVMQLIEKVIEYSRDMMGASDAALGNIKPENTSAIIAVQKATSMPLELQKMEFYQFIEDCVRIWLDMMAENYGVRPVTMAGPEESDVVTEAGPVAGDAMEGAALPAAGMPMLPQTAMPVEAAAPERETVWFDFSALRGVNLRLNVEIGASTYWSELMQVQTLDNLFERRIITDPELYVELVPSEYLADKQRVLEGIRKEKKRIQQEQMMQAAQAAAPEAGVMM